MKNKSKLLIITGPSGVGKGTIIKEIQKKNKTFWLSISATTRSAREGEIDGEHYFFLSKNKFEEMIEDKLFIEWAKFADNYYGTPLETINKKINEGLNVILEIEVEGAAQIKAKFPKAISIFIMPPSNEELERRIRNRGTDNEKSISKRLKRSEFEISSSKEFDYVLVNNSLDETVKRIFMILSDHN